MGLNLVWDKKRNLQKEFVLAWCWLQTVWGQRLSFEWEGCWIPLNTNCEFLIKKVGFWWFGTHGLLPWAGRMYRGRGYRQCWVFRSWSEWTPRHRTIFIGFVIWEKFVFVICLCPYWILNSFSNIFIRMYNLTKSLMLQVVLRNLNLKLN